MQIYAIGIASKNKKGEILDVFFPLIENIPKHFETITKFYQKHTNFEAVLTKQDFSHIQTAFASQQTLPDLPKNKDFLLVCLMRDTALETVAESYLKLHLLSKRLYKPHQLDLSNIFSVLPNVVWSNKGAIDINEIEERQHQSRLTENPILVKSLDKIPAMTDYIIPTKVRIGDAVRVRLGAYLGEGTTIMHEGFVNFNAGTQGPNMIEGRISAGVFVGKGTDLGGGCSIMGTLSGGGKTVISIGEDCLVGANAGLGISLGARCTVEAGLYLTAGTKVRILNTRKQEVMQIKAVSLSKKSDLLFRRNSLSGSVECLVNENKIELNSILHHN